MKIPVIILALLLALGAAAQPATNTFSQTVNALIPDANPDGYSSSTLVSGLAGVIQSLTVSLDITGGFNGDLYCYLAFGNGFAVLLNRTGKSGTDSFGYGDAGFNISLSDVAATDIHLYGGNGGSPLTGTWQPDGRAIDPELVVGTDARTALLSAFTGSNPNGKWTLFVADLAGGYQSTLANWSLTIATVPEPNSGQLLGMLGGLLTAGAWWRRRVQS